MDLINIIGYMGVLAFGGLFFLFAEGMLFTALVPFLNMLKITKLDPYDPFKVTGKNVTLNAVLILLLAITINALLFHFSAPLLYPFTKALQEGALFQIFLR